MIEGLEKMSLQELDLTMEEKASKFSVSEHNWPKDAPYAPDCNGSIARSSTHLAVMFHVRGLDIRATEMEDNGRSSLPLKALEGRTGKSGIKTWWPGSSATAHSDVFPWSSPARSSDGQSPC